MASASNPARATAPAEPFPAAAGLGVDVGGANQLRRLADPLALDQEHRVTGRTLSPVAVRENSKTHGVELRLVIGPIPDAEAASV